MNDGAFLFSVDLEDIRALVPGGSRYADRVAENTCRYLDLLDRHRMRCTFFTVGNVARTHPDLIREIAARGHELACHTSEHLPVSLQDAGSLRRDLARNVEDLLRAGARSVSGFRAPTHSLSPDTAWVHEVLAELGFAYSSSVLPAWNPRDCWPGFGRPPRRTGSGVWEIPVSVPALLGLPFAGGVYFRVLPFALVRRLYRATLADGLPVVGYLHPFDVDEDQERFGHPQLRGGSLLRGLMHHNRGRVLERVAALLAEGGSILPYAEYVERHLEAPADAPASARAQ